MKIKVAEIIKSFLDSELLNRKEFLMGNHTIQVDLPKYGNVQYGILHSPETYSRQWRAIREKHGTQDLISVRWQGLEIDETYKENSREKHFIIKKL